ncbi:MAG TPA: hypothetical protein VN651_13950 [Gemmatimonadaceae bacterium]|nr:hypothetical protein [Gemmatimonadaceae bacterium]
MTSSVLPLPRRRAHLAVYARWQALDFVMNVGVISLVVFGLLGVIALMDLHSTEVAFAASGKAMPLAGKLMMFMQIWGMFAAVAPLLATTGIVSQDRTAGYSRFLFAKPLSPRSFYLQSWLVRFAGYLVLGTLLVSVYSLYEPPSFGWRFLADMAMSYVAIGGIVFLLSVVTRFDGLLAAVFLLVADVAWAKWEGAPGLKHAVTFLLPPVSHLGAPHYWLLGINQLQKVTDVPFPTKWVVWNVGYGLACLLLGLYLLRKVSLTKA